MPNILELLPEILVVIISTAMLTAIGWAYNKWSNKLVVKRANKASKDLKKALELYDSTFSDADIMDDSRDMEQWLTEISELNRKFPSKWSVHLYIVKSRKAVIGFFYAEYHKKNKLLLISYIAADSNSRQEVSKIIADHLRKKLKKELKDCKGVIFELEKEGAEQRIRLFRHAANICNIDLKALDINYIQPKIKNWEPNYKEKNQVLVYGSTQGQTLDQWISKEEVVLILDTIYNEWYVSAYEDDPEHYEEYKAYIKKLFDKSVNELPDRIQTSIRVRE